MESGNIKDTFGKFKDKVNNSKAMTSIKNSKIAKRFAQDGPKVRKWVVDNWWKILIVSLIVTSIWFYMYHFYNRVPRYLKKMKAYDKIINPKELASSREISNGDYKLCDFFIASSYKSYLPCTNY